MREPTRQLVLQAVRTLGYRANPYARNLRATQSRIIAVYFSNPSRNYTSEIQIGAAMLKGSMPFSSRRAPDRRGWSRCAASLTSPALFLWRR